VQLNSTHSLTYLLTYQRFGNFQTITVSQCCLTKLLPYILFQKYIYILALEMASPGNQHCANCIGTLSFPIALFGKMNKSRKVADKNTQPT